MFLCFPVFWSSAFQSPATECFFLFYLQNFISVLNNRFITFSQTSRQLLHSNSYSKASEIFCSRTCLHFFFFFFKKRGFCCDYLCIAGGSRSIKVRLHCKKLLEIDLQFRSSGCFNDPSHCPCQANLASSFQPRILNTHLKYLYLTLRSALHSFKAPCMTHCINGSFFSPDSDPGGTEGETVPSSSRCDAGGVKWQHRAVISKLDPRKCTEFIDSD